MTKIQKELFALQDKEYQKFNSSLIPNIDSSTVIGVRTPALRSMAKELYKSGEYKDFIKKLPHKYFEENQLHSFILSLYKDFDELIVEIERFLPFVNNWATSDQLSPKMLAKNTDLLYSYILKWIKSDDTYTIRFGVDCLMEFYLGEHFSPAHLELVAEIESEEYYVNMMRAWYYATALAKQWEPTFELIKAQKLDKFTQNKSIQKARESYRITPEQKEILKGLKL